MPTNHLRVAIYARVSSERQAQEDTIASQLEALERRIRDDGLDCDPELRFIDDGVSGTLLLRPGLERLRDQAAAGAIDRLYVLDPDRFSRKYAYQVLILEELARCGVEVVFLCNPLGPDAAPRRTSWSRSRAMIAEYERAKIMERSRRGKQHAARRGSVNVLSGAPYGYRYIRKQDGDGEARYQVVAEEARVARKIFEWVGRDHCSIGEVTRRLKAGGHPHPDGPAGLGPRDDPCDPQEPGVQGDRGVRQDAGGAVQAAAAPAAARQAGIPQEADDPGRHAGGGPDPHRRPRPGRRGPVRGGPGATRGEPEADAASGPGGRPTCSRG